jgi:hypothetical protein
LLQIHGFGGRAERAQRDGRPAHRALEVRYAREFSIKPLTIRTLDEYDSRPLRSGDRLEFGVSTPASATINE